VAVTVAAMLSARLDLYAPARPQFTTSTTSTFLVRPHRSSNISKIVELSKFRYQIAYIFLAAAHCVSVDLLDFYQQVQKCTGRLEGEGVAKRRGNLLF
jgi:hypothetical protein